MDCRGHRELGGETMNRQVISVQQMNHLLETGRYTLIDVRPPRMYRQNHIPGAINLPYTLIDEWQKHLVKGQRYIIVCSRGNASLDAVKQLQNIGIQAVSVDGGMASYQ